MNNKSFCDAAVATINARNSPSYPLHLRRKLEEEAQASANSRPIQLMSSTLAGGGLTYLTSDAPVAKVRVQEPPVTALGMPLEFEPTGQQLKKLLSQHRSLHPQRAKEALAHSEYIRQLQLAGQLVITED